MHFAVSGIMENLKKRIKQARNNVGFSQSLLAEKVEIGLRTLQKYERDKDAIINITLQTLIKIAESCNVSAAWLILGLGNMVVEPTEISDGVNDIELQISDLVQQFRDKDIPKNILQNLLKIETDKIALSKIEAYIEGLSS